MTAGEAWTDERLRSLTATVLGEDGWAVTDDDGVLHLEPAEAGAEAPYGGLRVLVGPQPALVSVVVQAPEPVPDDRVAAVARVLAEANAGRLVGWFELDPVDGDLHVRAVLDLDGAELAEEQVAHLLRVLVVRAVDAMGEWVERIGDVVAGADPVA
ncbi:YbjN domain-containing protein [Nocardioides litoris]|uniref:YbjN domain-containing protein n=1 Tax=Nocardioides litoris TaxID=1926648 RepID=UPI0011238852|nr:YbjN domain-containing protein [Nocardioides litoris]